MNYKQCFALLLQIPHVHACDWLTSKKVMRTHLELSYFNLYNRRTIELFPGSANFGKTSQLFYYHITNLIQSKSII
jgi:hypothetical protein